MPSGIKLYAEFLLNIRQVTLYATLHNERDEASKAYVSSDRKSISVTHDNETSTIVYPSGISGKATVHIPIARGKIVSLRFETIEDGSSHGDGMKVANDSPWPASFLGADTRIACRACRSLIVQSSGREWQDLPRSDWAEMLDFWYCHRPHVRDSNCEDARLGRSRNSMEGPSLRHGLGFVDLCHLLVPEEECTGLEVG